MQYKGEQNRPRLKTHVFGQVFIIGVLLSCLFILPAISYYSSRLILQSSGTIGLDWLHTEDKSIVDSYGNVVILRGANFMGYEFGAWGRHEENDYSRMATWGFNVVRLPISWHYIEPQPGTYNLSYLETYVDRDIGWAKKRGIYIILDMHQWYWSQYFTFFSQQGEVGNGFPSWLVSGYPDTNAGYIKAVTDFWVGKGPNGTAPTDTNPSMQDRFINMWRQVAQKYSGESAIAGYDILNEPFSGELSWEEHSAYLYSFYGNLVSKIRESDIKHIIVYQHIPALTIKYARLLNYSNIMFSFHFGTLKDNYDGNQTKLRYAFLQYFGEISDWNIPVYVGEFNTHSEYPNAAQWIFDTVGIFNEYKLAWTWWSYYKSDYYTASLCYYDGAERIELTQHLKAS